MSSDKFVVKVANQPTVRVSESTTLISKIVVGTPIKSVSAASFNATKLGGQDPAYYLNYDNITNLPGNITLKNVEDTDSSSRYGSGVKLTGNISIKGTLVPDSDVRYNLGTPALRWGSLYVEGETIYVGGLALSDGGGGSLQTAQAIFPFDSAGAIDSSAVPFLANVRVLSTFDSERVNWVTQLFVESGGVDQYFDSAYVTQRVSFDLLDTLIDSDFVASRVTGLIQSVGSELTNTSAEQLIDTFSKNKYRTVKYLVQLDHDSDNKYYASEILLTHNGIAAYLTEYGIVQTAESLGDFDAYLTDGQVRLVLTPTYGNTGVKVKRISITA